MRRTLVLLGLVGCSRELQRPVLVLSDTEVQVFDAGTLSVTLGNGGEVPLGLYRVGVYGPDEDAFTPFADVAPYDGLMGAIPPGEEARVDVAFVPTHPGPHVATLFLSFGDGSEDDPAALRPTVDRRYMTAMIRLIGEAPGERDGAALSVIAVPTSAAPDEPITLDVASFPPAEALGDGTPLVDGRRLDTWAPDEAPTEAILVKIGPWTLSPPDGFQDWDFLEVVAASSAWFDEPIRP